MGSQNEGLFGGLFTIRIGIGSCPRPVTAYNRGNIKGYIEP